MQAGELLFNTPAVLGGQAARAELSCSSCHSNGRDNAHFFVDGNGAAPGTADVTSSFFGATRHNGTNDPVVIPDLAKPGKISRATDDLALERFVRTLIVEEFSGQEPTPATLSLLAGYIRAIRVCQGGDKVQNRRVVDQLALIDAAITGISTRQASRDIATARLLMRGARYQLGLISERYVARRFANERQLLLAASQRLQLIADGDDPTQYAPALILWQQELNTKIVARLIKGETHSLYDRGKIIAALGASTDGPRRPNRK